MGPAAPGRVRRGPSGGPGGSGGAKIDPKNVNPLDWGILGCGLLALIFSFFDWYTVTVTFRGVSEASGGENAWNGFFGWFAVLLAVVAAALVAVSIFAPQVKLPVPARLLALGLFALAVICMILALLVFPEDVPNDSSIDTGHGFGFWATFLVIIVGLVLTLMRFQATGGKLPGGIGSKVPNIGGHGPQGGYGSGSSAGSGSGAAGSRLRHPAAADAAGRPELRQQPPPAPGYGQQPPPAPGYGQQPPPAPGYGQQPPPAPGYGQQPLGLRRDTASSKSTDIGSGPGRAPRVPARWRSQARSCTARRRPICTLLRQPGRMAAQDGTDATATTARPPWFVAATTGAATALLGMVAAVAVVAMSWLPVSGGAGSAGSAIRAGVLTFLAALHAGITVDGLPTAFVPLG